MNPSHYDQYGNYIYGQVFENFFNHRGSNYNITGVNSNKVLEKFDFAQYGLTLFYKKTETFSAPSMKEYQEMTVYVSYENQMFLIINTSNVYFHYSHLYTQRMDEMTVALRKYRYKNKESRIHIVVSSPGGFDLKALNMPHIKLNLQENYNDDFHVVDGIIKKSLKESNKGVILLHGVPGTGKTTYIRHLINTVGKRVIFIPPSLTHELTHPSFINFLLNYPNSILIIEDAESVIMERTAGGSNSVANLLNVSDGLLSDVLQIQLLCTFNADIAQVDSALLRKGRVIATYEFKELSVDKCNVINTKIGLPETTEPMTLSSLYNQEKQDFSTKKKRKIGFL